MKIYHAALRIRFEDIGGFQMADKNFRTGHATLEDQFASLGVGEAKLYQRRHQIRMQRQTRLSVVFAHRRAHRHRRLFANQIKIAPAKLFQFAVTNTGQHRRQIYDMLFAGHREQGGEFQIIIRAPRTDLPPARLAFFHRQQGICRNPPLRHEPSKKALCAGKIFIQSFLCLFLAFAPYAK